VKSGTSSAVLAHFDMHRRAMPWRETGDPYAIWVSEVMLQQTRVDTVRPYYRRWMGRFPTVQALAAAELDDVLRVWQGLGYYARARNLHRAARLICRELAGRVPDTVEGLRLLPGVGEYTAGAVASIAFGVRTPAVDGNVRRVLSRLYDLEAPSPSRLRELATGLVPAERPGDFNQALMELGATLCTPRSPDCAACPLAQWCRARALGVQEARPRRVASKPVPARTARTAVLLRQDGRVLLVRRRGGGLLAGLWEFPDDAAPAPARALVGRARRRSSLAPVVHTFSHLRVTYRPTLYDGLPAEGLPADALPADGHPAAEAVEARAEAVETRGAEVAWARLDDLAAFPMPVAQQRIAALVLEAVGDIPTKVSTDT
jgi:A/G-specific adenine glycosylase